MDICFLRIIALCKLSFNVDKLAEFIKEPFVYLSDSMDLVNSRTSSECLKNDEESFIVALMKSCSYLFITKLLILRSSKIIKTYLSASYSLHDSLFKGCADSHYLTCCLHLSTEVTLSVNELIERPLRQLNYNVVERRLEAGICLACNGILDLIKGIADSDLSCDLGDRITCCL